MIFFCSLYVSLITVTKADTPDCTYTDSQIEKFTLSNRIDTYWLNAAAAAVFFVNFWIFFLLQLVFVWINANYFAINGLFSLSTLYVMLIFILLYNELIRDVPLKVLKVFFYFWILTIPPQSYFIGPLQLKEWALNATLLAILQFQSFILRLIILILIVQFLFWHI